MTIFFGGGGGGGGGGSGLQRYFDILSLRKKGFDVEDNVKSYWFFSSLRYIYVE